MCDGLGATELSVAAYRPHFGLERRERVLRDPRRDIERPLEQRGLRNHLVDQVDGLRIELKPQGTTVLGVHFGYVDTDMTRGVTAPKENPQDIAERIVAAVVAGESELLADGTAQFVKKQLATSGYLTS